MQNIKLKTVKYILFSFILLLFNQIAAQSWYENQWKTIEKNEKDGKYKSNLPLAESVFNKAKQENNTHEIIKSLLYSSNIKRQTEEDNLQNDTSQNHVNQLNDLILTAKNPIEKSWFQYILALKLYEYYSQNLWKFRNSTNLKENSNLISEWNKTKFKGEIISLYEKIEANKSLLLKEKLDNWNYILSPNKYDNLNPCLYHIFVDGYINFLNNNYAFSFSDEEKMTNNQKIGSIYVNLTENYKQKQETDAFLYTQNQYLSYLLSSKLISKEDYFQSLESLINSNTADYTSQIMFHLASLYNDEAVSDKYKTPKVKALEICNLAIQKYPKSKWTQNSRELKKQLEWKDANILIHNTVSANLPIPIGISHRNSDEIFVRIYTISDFEKFIKKDKTDYRKSPLKINAPIVFSDKISLKQFNDYQEHKSVYKLNALQAGNYKLVISNNENFEGNDSLKFVKTQDFLVSKFNLLSKIKREYEKGRRSISEYEIQILNRESGKALQNTMVEIFNFNDKTDKLQKVITKTTNNVGMLLLSNTEFKKEDYIEDLFIKIPSEKEFFSLESFGFSDNYYNEYDENEENVIQKIASIFTDRAIYRPSQTLYFKSILYEKRKDESKIITNKKATVTLYNTHSEKVSELELTSNDFGSVFGEFILPKNGITGNFHLTISVDNEQIGSDYFKVEEYKRPKFEVKFNDLKGNYTLNQKTEVKGNSIAFSGAAISDAKVVYRVTRQEIFPFPLWNGFRCYFPYRPYQQPEEIEHGETKTNEKGEFNINFVTKIPETNNDKLITKNKNPQTFSYTIYADVTDVNGETHSSQILLNAGDIPKKLEIVAKDNFSNEEAKTEQITINSTNLNGQKVAAKGKVKITKLEAPNRVISPTKFPFDGDYNLLSNNELQEKFPHLSFDKNETNKEFWKRGKVVLETQFNNPSSLSPKGENDGNNSGRINNNEDWGVLKAPFGGLGAGNYVIEAFEMYGSDTIRSIKYIEIYDAKTLTSEKNNYLVYHWEKASYKVGETAKLVFNSDAENGTIFYKLASELHKKDTTNSLELINGTTILEIPIIKGMENGSAVYFYFLKFNDNSNEQIQIPIEKEIPNLEITAKTFRQKMEPGKPETWEIHISGKDKDKVSAELLASMYDASLDTFASQSYSFNPYQYSYYPHFSNYEFRQNYLNNCNALYDFNGYYYGHFTQPILRNLNLFYNLNFDNGNTESREVLAMSVGNARKQKASKMAPGKPRPYPAAPVAEMDGRVSGYFADNVSMGGITVDSTAVIDDNKINFQPKPKFDNVQIRKNLQETAFFLPSLYTDEKGDVILKFTSPEALTKWKLLLLAHTKDLKIGTKELYSQTQKELMVVPNPPRFLRENDEIEFQSKITNLSENDLSGNAVLQIFDAFTNKPIDNLFDNSLNIKEFSVPKKGNIAVSWKLKIPTNIGAIVYKVIAKTDTFSDGEENSLPILTNRTLVTETVPISIKKGQTKTFNVEKLQQNQSKSLQNFNLTLELNTNPIWMAITSLPYLREFPYECSEQLFSRLYGNMLSNFILNSNPKIKNVFDELNTNNLITSKLEQNEELKNILLEETPWLRDAQDEGEKMKRLAVFFDLNKMNQELKQAKDKLINRQKSNGSFSWFEGGNEDYYISNYILAGFGKLKNLMGEKLDILLEDNGKELIKKSVTYLDDYYYNEYQRIKKENKYKPNYYGFSQYLYARSFWLKEYPLKNSCIYTKMMKEAIKAKTFTDEGLQTKALNSVVLNRYGFSAEAKKILLSLKETSVESENNGMYWKENKSGWYWYDSPIETQSIIIEAFNEILPEDENSAEEMKIWLIKNKKTNNWNSTKATCEAVYVLMNNKNSTSWLNQEEGVKINAPQFQIPTDNVSKTGLIKTSIKGNDIKAESGKVEITKTSNGIALGGIYWQYFEDLDKISSAEGGIAMKKQLFIKKNTDKGPELQEISEKSSIKIGDLVTVRLIIKTENDMEYIHLKDMRASGFEPVNVISSYKYQNGIGYYESTRDAATNFFISYLPKGNYIFEYEVRANNAGNFSNGITTLQNMYAPEMSAHSEGIMVKIKN